MLCSTRTSFTTKSRGHLCEWHTCRHLTEASGSPQGTCYLRDVTKSCSVWDELCTYQPGALQGGLEKAARVEQVTIHQPCCPFPVMQQKNESWSGAGSLAGYCPAVTTVDVFDFSWEHWHKNKSAFSNHWGTKIRSYKRASDQDNSKQLEWQ